MAEEVDERESRRAREKQEENDWVMANIGESYTDAFRVRKVMYRINDLDLPFRNGVRQEQFIAFILGFFFNLAFLFIFIYPLIKIFYSGHIAIRFHLILLFALPTLLAMRIGKPTPTGKTLPGRFMTWLRNFLDDEWHRRGRPIPHTPLDENDIQGNYQRTWYVDPAFAGVEEPKDQPISVFATYAHQDLPDNIKQVLPQKERRERKRILESEEEFIARLQSNSTLGEVDWEEEKTSDKELVAKLQE